MKLEKYVEQVFASQELVKNLQAGDPVQKDFWNFCMIFITLCSRILTVYLLTSFTVQGRRLHEAKLSAKTSPFKFAQYYKGIIANVRV